MFTKRGKLFLLGVIILLVIGGFWAWQEVTSPELFPIRHVQIKATFAHINPDVLQKIIAPEVSKGFFGLHVAKLQQKLLKESWVYAATVERIWPDAVVVQIIEQQAVALWNTRSLLNSEASIFSPSSSTFPDDLPALFGPDTQAKRVWYYYLKMNSALSPLGLSIKDFGLNVQGQWLFVLNNDIKVFLGDTDIKERLERFLEVYPKIIAPKSDAVVSVDLRYNKGLAVKWRHGKLRTLK